MFLGREITRTFGELLLKYFLFMIAVFAGGGMANGSARSKRQIHPLDLSMLALPASAVISAVVVIYLYNTDAGR